ncbi:MAG: alpha/beta hydrolase family esterase [Rhodospirillales bacterium]
MSRSLSGSTVRMLAAVLALVAGVGCSGKGAPAEDGLPPQLLEQHRIVVGGLERTYRLFVPPSDQGGGPFPLVLLFHGGGGNGLQFARVTRADELAVREGFVVVYPDGMPLVGPLGRGGDWNAGADPPQTPAEIDRIDDVAFVRALLEKLAGQYRIDPKRIYATGLSRGAMLSYHLACTLSERVAAIAPVAGAMTTADCRPKEAVAVLHIHGLTDQFVRVEGGRGVTQRYEWPAVGDGLAFWRRANGCPEPREPTLETTVAQCWQHRGCASGRPVGFCAFEGGHVWPGQPDPPRWQERLGMKPVAGFSASEHVWAFFKANPK